MTRYDAVMIGMVVAGMVWGAIRGITWQLASIASLVLAYFFSHQVSAYIAPYIPGEPVVERAGSMLAAYVLVSAGVFFAAWTVRATLKKMKFEAYDRHLGMMLGGLEGGLLGIIGTLFVVSLAPGSREPIFASHSGHLVAKVMDAAGPVLPAEVRRVVTPYWEDVRKPERPQVAETQVGDDFFERTSAELTNDKPDKDRSSLQDLAKGARSRIGRAMGDALKAEVERLGENDDEREFKRR